MNDPSRHPSGVVIDRAHTHCGDQGITTLAGGQRVAKDCARIEACGVIEELSASIGAARTLAEEITAHNGRVWPLVPILLRVQHELSNLSSILCSSPEDVPPGSAAIIIAGVGRIEEEIVITDLPPLRLPVLPGSGRLNAALHQCRAVCRRAERATVSLGRQEPVPPEIIRYLNRLGDAFLVWSRWASHLCNESDTVWTSDDSAPY